MLHNLILLFRRLGTNIHARRAQTASSLHPTVVLRLKPSFDMASLWKRCKSLAGASKQRVSSICSCEPLLIVVTSRIQPTGNADHLWNAVSQQALTPPSQPCLGS